jgi:hypothetical protein
MKIPVDGDLCERNLTAVSPFTPGYNAATLRRERPEGGPTATLTRR